MPVLSPPQAKKFTAWARAEKARGVTFPSYHDYPRGRGRAVTVTVPRVIDISTPAPGYSVGVWENIKKTLGEEVARKIKAGTYKSSDVKFEFYKSGRLKRAVTPKVGGGKTTRHYTEVGKQVTEKELKDIQEAKVIATKKRAEKIRDVKLGAATIEPWREPTGFLERTRHKLSVAQAKARTKQLRKPGFAGLTGFGIGVGKSVLGTVQFGKQFITEPVETTKKTAVGLYEVSKKVVTGEGFPEVGRILREEPGYATGYIGAEIGQALIGGYALGKGTKLAGRITTRISPKYKKIITKPSGEKVIKFPDIDELKLLEKPVGKIGEPISKQIRLAGKQVQPVSAARDVFGKIFKRKVKIEKPKLPKAPELERAFFADPYGRARVSRLGVGEPKRASIIDLLSGDVGFKRAKSQILIFKKQPLAKFPKELKTIAKKLKAGKPLTAKEIAKLERWQLTPTGEFKPLGFISREPEIVLAPGEIIYKKKVVGVTEIGGKKVTIIRTGIKKATKKTKQLLAKAEKKGLTIKESVELSKRLVKETGFSYMTPSKPYFAPSRVLGYVGAAVYGLPSAKSQIKGVSSALGLISTSKPIKKISKVMPSPISLGYKTPKKLKAIRVEEPYPIYKPPYKPPKIVPLPAIPPKPIPVIDEYGYRLKKKKPKPSKRKKQKIAYQPSVGAVVLGITAPEEYFEQVGKVSGLGLRPAFPERQRYLKQLQESQNYLMGSAYETARKKSPRAAVSRLKQQQYQKTQYAYGSPKKARANLKKMQNMLVGGGYGGKKKVHIKRLRTNYAAGLDRTFTNMFGFVPKKRKARRAKKKKKK